MICPLCSGETKVMDSRDSDHLVRRRRECSACRYRFSTHEAEESLLVTEEDLGQMIDQIQDIATWSEYLATVKTWLAMNNQDRKAA
jgi:hypothetical protein